MNAIASLASPPVASPRLPICSVAATPFADPLDPDDARDDVVVTTRRAITRVALVAAEAAGRFQREAVRHDPMTWMLAPRTLFGGATALDACLDRDACLRGVLLHGLSLGLDADPDLVDRLIDGEDDGTVVKESMTVGAAPDVDDGHGVSSTWRGQRSGGPRLFTATVVAEDGRGTIQAFHASLAENEAEIAGRLRMRMGAAADDATIVPGFDHTLPIVEALVSPALCDTLVSFDADPGSPLADGLDLTVEQRFHR